MVERRIDTDGPGIWNESMCRLEPDDAAPRCGNANRAALVAANRQVDIIVVKRRRRTARGATREMIAIVRIARWAESAGIAGAGECEVIEIQLRDDFGARVENSRDEGGVVLRYVAFHHEGAAGHRDSGHRDTVLDPHALARKFPRFRSPDRTSADNRVQRVVLGLRPKTALTLRILERRDGHGHAVELVEALEHLRQHALEVGKFFGAQREVISGG